MIFQKSKLIACLVFGLSFSALSTANASSWVWRASQNGKSVIIFGVIHYGTESSVQKLNMADCLSLLSEADRVYFETIPTDWEASGVRNFLSKKGSLPLGKKIAETVPKQAAEAYHRVATPEIRRQVDHLQPWNAAAVIYRTRLAQLGYTYENSLERQLYWSLFKAKRKTKSLESPFDQLKALSELPSAAENDFFLSSVIPDTAFNQSVASIFSAFQEGELRKMRAALNNSPFNVAALDQKLLKERNHKWAQSISKLQRFHKNLGIIVGIEHLVKENDSLLEQLKKQGYTVERIR